MSLALVVVSCGDDPVDPGDETLTPAVKALIQHRLDSTAEANGIVGATVGLKLANGEEWYTRVGTIHTVDPNVAIQPADTMPNNAQFRIGSITKTFTATVILQLIDEGRFTLQSNVSDILPELTMRYFDFDTITVHDLLQHTSGIQNYTNDAGWTLEYLQDPLRSWTPDELIVVADSLGNAPIDQYAPYPWLYSNTNYIILGKIIEKVTGNTAAAAITSRILTRLGMSSSFFALDATPTSTMARGYSDFSCPDYTQAPPFPGRGEKYYDITVLDPSQGWTAGAVVSNTRDLLIYVEALVEGDLISPAMQSARLDNMLPAGKDGSTGFYGLGIARVDPNWIGHKGGFNGFDLSMYGKPGVASLIVLTNIGGTGCSLTGAPVLFQVVTKALFNETPAVKLPG
jgi:D-alanyl-D-alanine carboxypeptidase